MLPRAPTSFSRATCSIHGSPLAVVSVHFSYILSPTILFAACRFVSFTSLPGLTFPRRSANILSICPNFLSSFPLWFLARSSFLSG